MAKIARKWLKIFAKDATNNGVFGSAQDGTKVLSSDPEVIQNKPAWLTGWLDAVLGTKKFPALEEFQSLGYISTYQLAYLLQEGIPEYNVLTTYFTNSVVKKAGTYEIYGSITNDNVGNALTDVVNWVLLQDLSATVPDATETVKGIAEIATSAETATGTDDTRFITPLKLAPYVVPPGAVFPFAGTAAPSGYLLCYGQSVLRADYPALFTAIGTVYGSVDGTHFNIPDARGRVLAGKDNMGGTPAGRLTGASGSVNGNVLGAGGGEETHTLTVAETPAHHHPLAWDQGGALSLPGPGVQNGTMGNGNDRFVDDTNTMQNVGGDDPHNNVQPTIILNTIIKT